MNSGGRVDVWRRLLALRGAGAVMGLLTWYDGPRDGEPGAELRAQLAAHCESIHLACISRRSTELFGRLLNAWRWPSHVASRWVTLDRPRTLEWARGFRPTLLLADGLYGAHVVRWLAAELGVPWVYRSHNIEHHYMQMQLAQASRLKSRLGLMANLWGLARFEREVQAHAGAVLDISTSDMAYWRAQGIIRSHWMPPIVDRAFAEQLAGSRSASRPYHAMYFGNLNTPNNVEAVRWFVQRVLPLVRAPDYRFAIAGSRPSAEVEALARSDGRIQLIPNPVEIAPLLVQARVLVNPVQGGSGVNLKSVEMLYSQAHLLSTRIGVQGLPAEVAECFTQADDPQSFADQLQSLASVDTPVLDAQGRRLRARACFSSEQAVSSFAEAIRPLSPGLARTA
ncbi:glycosyltransferase [Paucibacter sp. PLA-PC-4]|uniref:glycosyltransferase n=1 Tax=Paucibacter sp. PLA-PC-4 TaxID=2993655 RepID=UPI00224AB717|nr:glycosyltransferase [Paucibacter sp. PLA-PC-4]MCX2865283.1 glycosyltransferase [Paucibacter sp. PLA-PC-4]